MLEGDDLKAYQNADLVLTRDPADWHLYNPNGERDARLEAEGLHTIPSRQFLTIDEGNSDVASVSPDLDL
jgi:hypothetical protein